VPRSGYCDADDNTNGDSFADGESKPDAKPDADRDFDSNANAYCRDADANGDAKRFGNAKSDAFAHAKCFGDTKSKPVSDANHSAPHGARLCGRGEAELVRPAD